MDRSAVLLQQIKSDLEGQGVLGELADDGTSLIVDVAGTPHRIHVQAEAQPETVVS